MTHRPANRDLEALLHETGWSHARLAREVVQAGSVRYGLRLAYDYRAVGRWLRGAVPEPPTPELIAQVLSRALGRSLAPNDLGFCDTLTLTRFLELPSDPAGSVTTTTHLWRTAVDMDRRKFLNAAFVTACAVEGALDWSMAPAYAQDISHDGPRQVTSVDIDRISDAYTEFGELDHRHGGKYALSWLLDYLDTNVAPMLNGRYTHAIGVELFRKAAALTDMAGWMAMDGSHHKLAQGLYTQAIGLAKQSGDTAFGAYVWSNLATQALLLGKTGTTVRLARTALHGNGHSIPASLTARISVTEARAHALRGDSHETRRAIRHADHAMEQANPNQDPEWLGTWTPAHHAGGVMHALRDLGNPAEAAALARQALDLPPANTRTKALHTCLHATVLAAQGELDAAAATAHTAADTARGLTSARLRKRLHELDEQLAPHNGVNVIADARAAIHDTNATS